MENPMSVPAIRAGLWSLPVYGMLLGLSTITHQPPVSDFGAYARYVSTNVFLISHLGASIFGAALAILGAVAVTAYLVRGRAARLAVAGMALTTVTNVFMAAAFGSAAFAQPGIGRAYLNGVAGMPALNADTAYGPALTATALTSTAFFVISAIVLGTAIARTHRVSGWASPPRCSATRPWYCSTSRSTAWTRMASAGSEACCATWRARAAPCSSPRT
jgi:hypothetical protein